MKFTEAQLEAAIIELLEAEGCPHVSELENAGRVSPRIQTFCLPTIGRRGRSYKMMFFTEGVRKRVSR